MSGASQQQGPMFAPSSIVLNGKEVDGRPAEGEEEEEKCRRTSRAEEEAENGSGAMTSAAH